MIEGRSERAGRALLSIATLTGFPTVKLGVSPRLRKISRPQDKKLAILALAPSVATLGIPFLAHGKPQEMNRDDKKPVLMNIKSTVKADGDKITFVADEGGKSWDVIIPRL